MLYRFKSKAAADLIMLEADATRLLRIMCGEASAQGILRGPSLVQGRTLLQAAVDTDEQARALLQDKIRSGQASEQDMETYRQQQLDIRLAQRAQPMLVMLSRCLAEEADLLWGV